MLQQNELKFRGLRYLKTLQVVFRMATMFSVDHLSVAGPMQQSFDVLNALIKETRQLTVGFVDNRVMINNILTTDAGLSQLENELLKRGIGGLSFEPGITLGGYKHAIGVLATPVKEVEELGGATVLIAANPIEGVKIFPAGKNQARTEDGDTIIETDAQSFLRAKQYEEQRPFQIPTAGLELVFASAGMERPADMRGGPDDILRMVAPTVEAALVGESGDPQRSYMGLARMMQEVSPSFILNFFPPEKQKELADKPPQEIASEFMEETAMRWASKRLASVPQDGDALVVEEDVVRVLVRTLQATQMAEKLAERLAHYVKEYTLPKSVYERLQNELNWTATPNKQKVEKLLRLKRFGGLEFRRLMDLLKDLVAHGKSEEATALAKHYFNFLDEPPEGAQPEPFSRATEVLRMMAGVRTDFGAVAAERLAKAVLDERYPDFVHYQIANCLSTLSKAMATFEDFELAQQAGLALEKSLGRDRAKHAQCCGAAMNNLLAPNSMERILELMVIKRDDPVLAKLGTSLLRWAGPAAVEKTFQRLEEEPNASARMVLVRIMGSMGENGIEVARQRLDHTRWYVVRNACQVLGELKDPLLLEHIGPLLRHSDHRVQQSAFNVLRKSRLPNRGKVLAEALPELHAHLLEQALEELAFFKDPEALPGLERFVAGDGDPKKPLDKAVFAIANTPGGAATEALLRLLAEPRAAEHARRAALHGLMRRKDGGVRAQLDRFAAGSDADPMVNETRQALARADATKPA